MEGERDYNQYDEADLIEMFGRMDPQRLPAGCARLKELLIERGYIVHDGGIGPGCAIPSPTKMQALIGSAHPLEFRTAFSQREGTFSRLEPARNDFHLGGAGTVSVDGIHLRLCGRRAGLFGWLFQVRDQLMWRGIVNVEFTDSVVHLEYRAPDSPNKAVTLWFEDQSTAERLARVLPKERTPEFSPRLKALVAFERQLISQSPRVPVTVSLVAINTLVFLATVLVGAEWLVPQGAIKIIWGSNFGPFTTDGEWWRLLTSLFIHFGIVHLVFNMWALAIFGPLCERIYGSINFLAIYVFAGLAASLASISWRPDINSAGSSGAVLGILGALLAAQLRAGETFPSDTVRSLRNLTITFLVWTLYSGFAYKGIDNAAHIGGLASGFLLGLVLARPVTGDKCYTRADFKRFLQMLPVAVLIAGGGFWLAQYGSRTGEVQYWRTVHWLDTGEKAANGKYDTALNLAKSESNSLLLTEAIEEDVLPFWRDASERLSGIELSPDSQHVASLKRLRDLANGRVQGYELFAQGLRKNDSQEISAAQEKLKQAEQAAAK